MVNKLILTVGNIASGKSTWCKSQVKNGSVVVCNDDITTMIHGGQYLYDHDLKSLYKGIEEYSVIKGLQEGRNTILDRMNYKSDTRKRWAAIAKDHGFECWVILFPRESPEIHAKRRYDKDNRGVSYERWLKVAKEFEENYEDINMGVEGIQNVINTDGQFGLEFMVNMSMSYDKPE